MQMTKRGLAGTLIEIALDLEAPPTDAVSLEPVDLRAPEVAFREEAYERDAFELAPTTFAISLREVSKDLDAGADRYYFDVGDITDDLEHHALGF
jgi:hypothetical protein